MSFKEILVPVRGDGKGESVLNHAIHMAKPFNGHLDVVYVKARPEDMLPYGVPIMSDMRSTIMEAASRNAEGDAERVRVLFDDYCSKAGLSVVDGPPWPTDGVSISWNEVAGKQASVVTVRGRLSDAVAVARPDPDAGLGHNTLEAALLETGRLVLMVPPRDAHEADWGTHIGIAWNGGKEAAGAVRRALPMLRAAEKVTILVSPDDNEEEPTSAGLKGYLATHGVEAAIHEFPSKVADVGPSLLAECAANQIDSLVMGGYGHSRQREMILGGVTEHIIHHAQIPILLAH